MSLINDVLKDLERRQSAQSLPHEPPASHAVHSTGGLRIFWWLGVAVVAGIVLHWGLNGHSPDAAPASTMQAAMPESRVEPEPIPVAVQDQPTASETTTPAPTDAVDPPEAGTLFVATATEARPVSIEQVPDNAEAETASEPRQSAQSTPADEPRSDEPDADAVGDHQPEAQAPAQEPLEPSNEPSQRRSENSDITIQRAGEEAEPDAADELDAARRALARNQYQSANRRLSSLLEREPGHDEARLLLANSLIKRGDGRKAVNLLDDGLDQSDTPAELARLLGRLLIDRGETARAREVLQAHAPEPINDPDYHQLLAAAHRQAGDHEAAMKSYLQLAEIVPGRGAVWIGLGASLEALDHNDDARDAYTRALEANDPRAARFARQRLNAIDTADRGR